MSMEDTVDAVIRRRRYNRWNISLSELTRDERAKDVVLTAPWNEDILRSLLFAYGLDIDKYYEVEVCEHRNVFDEVVFCPYFLGIERTDVRWNNLKTGLVSGTWKVAA